MRRPQPFSIPFVAPFLLLLLLHAPPPLEACEGEPISPSCGRTAVLGLSTPPNVLATGGEVKLEALLFLGVSEFPAGSMICPPDPFFVDFDFTVTCMPSGDTTGEALDIPVTRGFNEISILLDLPSGPVRMCTIDATAAIEFVDGTTVTASGGTQICMVEESTVPGVPRLELENLGPGLARVHPGDQASHRVRLTNNDATETWDGSLDATMVNRSLLPLIAGPVPPGHGVYGIADPAGDHFPIAFADEIAACLPLPPEPHLVPIPEISRDLVLAPGASTELEIVSRPWGMCADGTCGQGLVKIVGLFSDASAGFACSGFATAADIGVPPSFLWPDTGATALMGPPLDPLLPELPFSGAPIGLVDPFSILFQVPMADLLLEGVPPLPATPLASEIDAERGRIGLGFEGPGLFPSDSPFGIGFRLDLPPDPAGDVVMTEIIAMGLAADAPTGLADVGPLVVGQLEASRGAGMNVEKALFDLVLRISGEAKDNLDQTHQVLFGDVQVLPQPDSSGVDFFAEAQVAPGSAQQIDELDIFLDFRAHAKLGEAIFADGFEAGDVSAWSSSAP